MAEVKHLLSRSSSIHPKFSEFFGVYRPCGVTLFGKLEHPGSHLDRKRCGDEQG